MSKNGNLKQAKKAKNDEFYTRLEDISNELKYYNNHFKNKVIYCNCDDDKSNFYRYFYLKFDFLKLKKLICTHYNKENLSYKIEVFRKEDYVFQHNDDIIEVKYDTSNNLNIVIVKSKLKTNGDFRSPESIEMLKESDIVVTNPPFSLFREYINLLVKYNKKFLIIGNNNACSYKEIFKIIKENKLWLGYNCNKTMEFQVPPTYEFKKGKFRKDEKGNYYIKVPAITWFTNLGHKKRNEEMILYKKYNQEDCPKYDNYPAFNVDKVCDIPSDEYIITETNKDELNDFKKIYKNDLEVLEEINDKIKLKINNPMYGVPITFLCKYNPEQFEIIGQMTNTKINEYNFGYPFINGKRKYARIIIRRKV